jgi:hypothetical protein
MKEHQFTAPDVQDLQATQRTEVRRFLIVLAGGAGIIFIFFYAFMYVSHTLKRQELSVTPNNGPMNAVQDADTHDPYRVSPEVQARIDELNSVEAVPASESAIQERVEELQTNVADTMSTTTREQAVLDRIRELQ